MEQADHRLFRFVPAADGFQRRQQLNRTPFLLEKGSGFRRKPSHAGLSGPDDEGHRSVFIDIFGFSQRDDMRSSIEFLG